MQFLSCSGVCGNTIFKNIPLRNDIYTFDVLSIVEDTTGFKWFGTRSGLYRYDGVGLKNFPFSTVYFNNQPTIFHLLVQQNKLWLATSNGLQCFNLTTESFTDLKYQRERIDSKIYKLIPETDSSFYICSTRGLYKAIYRDEDFFIKLLAINNSSHQEKLQLPVNVKKMAKDRHENYWVVSHEKLFQYKKNKDNELSCVKEFKKGFFSRRINDLFCYQNYVIIAQNDKLIVFKYDNETNTLLTHYTFDANFFSNYLGYSLDPNDTHIRQIVNDKNNNLFVATTFGLIKIAPPYNQLSKITVINKQQLKAYHSSNVFVLNLHIDNDNVLWAGLLHNGVKYIKLDEPKINYHYMPNSKSEKFRAIKGFIPDDFGNVWMSTQNNGIYKTKNNEIISHYSVKENTEGLKLSSNKIWTMYKNDEDIWVCNSQGIDIISTSGSGIRKVIIKEKPGNLPTKRILVVQKDAYGRMWLGAQNGRLYCLKAVKKDKYRLIDIGGAKRTGVFYNASIIGDILADTVNNKVLIGSSQGLTVLKLNKAGNIDFEQNYVPKNFTDGRSYINNIVKFNDSTYFANVFNGMLYSLTKTNSYEETWQLNRINALHGLKTDNVVNISVFENQLIISGNGIQVYNPLTGFIYKINELEFLPTGFYGSRLSYVDEYNSLWLGTHSGYMTVEINKNYENKKTGSVVFTDLKVNYKDISYNDSLRHNLNIPQSIAHTRHITLKHNQNNFQVNCAFLDYKSIGNNLFYYTLQGEYNNWVYTQNPELVFSGLSPGKYKLMVRGINGDGIKSNSTASLSIRIKPPLAVSAGFILMYIIIAFVLGRLVYTHTKQWVKLQNDLKVNKKLQQLKLQFFTNVAHEIKTPLTLVIEPLKELVVSPAYKNNTSIQLAYKNSKKIIKLLNELIDFRKSENSEPVLKCRLTKFNPFVNEIVQAFNSWAERKKIELHFLPTSKEIELWIDHGHIEKVISNLISNAIKYTPEGGSIIVETIEDVELKYEPKFKNEYKVENKQKSNSYAGLKVYDTGIGISEASLPKIFERFYQVDPRQSRHIGSGVGLALVKNIVLHNGGEIYISSERNVGTEYYLAFPKGDSHLTSEQKLYENSDRIHPVIDIPETQIKVPEVNRLNINKNYTILLVEDDNDFRKYLVSKLCDEFFILEAANGKEALELIKEHIPDVIVSDWLMPGLNGIDLLNKIKKNKEYTHIPFVMLSAKSEEQSKLRGLTSGAYTYLTKPFAVEILEATIVNLLNSKNKLLQKFSDDYFYDIAKYSSSSKDKDFIKMLTELILLNLDNSDLGVDLISQLSGMSKTSLYNKVKSITNQSLKQLITQIKFKTAAKFLLEDGMSVAEVAYKVGLSSPSVFSRSFKEYFNCTPTEFVKKHTG